MEYQKDKSSQAEEEEKLVISVGGMTCAACVNRVEKTLQGLPGVREAGVNLATEKATIYYQPAHLGKSELRKAVEDLGYEVRGFEEEGLIDKEQEARAREIFVQKRKFILSAVLPSP